MRREVEAGSITDENFIFAWTGRKVRPWNPEQGRVSAYVACEGKIASYEKGLVSQLCGVPAVGSHWWPATRKT